MLQVGARARILIAGQAPGRKVHASGIPFDDASGERLRAWMGVSREEFYDARRIAILPMGFCYPGTGATGDLPPRPECAAQWRERLLAAMPHVALTLVLGRHALQWHLPQARTARLTDVVKAWRTTWPEQLVLPHPSGRNNGWLSANPWFDEDVLPHLRSRVRTLMAA